MASSALACAASGVRAAHSRRRSAGRPVASIASAKPRSVWRSIAAGRRWSPERRQELADKAHRVVLLDEAEAADLDVTRPVVGAEEQIPDDQRVRVVVVRLLGKLRVVPAMHLGAADQVVEPTEPQLGVRMLEEPARRIDDEVIGEHAGCDAENDEGQAVAEELQ